MKKSFSALSVLALALTSAVATPTAALADPGKNQTASDSEYCRYISEVRHPGEISFGECMASVRSDDSADPAQYCIFLVSVGLLESRGGFANLGECVTAGGDIGG